jgi:hypothetical protein
MRRLLVACGMLLLAAALPPVSAQRAAAADDLCGEPKATPQALYARLSKDGRLREMHRNEEYIGLENGQDGTLWTFTLPAHSAHPAAICRRMMERRGVLEIPTAIVCEGGEAACAKLKSDFDALNARIIEDLYKPRR